MRCPLRTRRLADYSCSCTFFRLFPQVAQLPLSFLAGSLTVLWGAGDTTTSLTSMYLDLTWAVMQSAQRAYHHFLNDAANAIGHCADTVQQNAADLQPGSSQADLQQRANRSNRPLYVTVYQTLGGLLNPFDVI